MTDHWGNVVDGLTLLAVVLFVWGLAISQDGQAVRVATIVGGALGTVALSSRRLRRSGTTLRELLVRWRRRGPGARP